MSEDFQPHGDFHQDGNHGGNRSSDQVQVTPAQIERWRRYLANERAEADVYRELAKKRTGEERDILLKLAEAESRHEAHWRKKLVPLKAHHSDRTCRHGSWGYWRSDLVQYSPWHSCNQRNPAVPTPSMMMPLTR